MTYFLLLTGVAGRGGQYSWLVQPFFVLLSGVCIQLFQRNLISATRSAVIKHLDWETFLPKTLCGFRINWRELYIFRVSKVGKVNCRSENFYSTGGLGEFSIMVYHVGCLTYIHERNLPFQIRCVKVHFFFLKQFAVDKSMKTQFRQSINQNSFVSQLCVLKNWKHRTARSLFAPQIDPNCTKLSRFM